MYKEARRNLGEVFRRFAEQQKSRIEEGQRMPDHVHMMISNPPKYAVSQGMRYSPVARGLDEWTQETLMRDNGHRLSASPVLQRMVPSANGFESCVSAVRQATRNVKRRQRGEHSGRPPRRSAQSPKKQPRHTGGY
jgi:hypothetical protein